MTSGAWSRMDYKNTETKLDTLVSYFNDERINLVPISNGARYGHFPCVRS